MRGAGVIVGDRKNMYQVYVVESTFEDQRKKYYCST